MRRLTKCAAVFAIALGLAGVAAGQTTLPAPSGSGSELPDSVRAALAQTEDFSFSFSQPGFYALLEYLKNADRPPGLAQPPLEIDDWSVLLERPADLRGLPITIEGVVGRNKAWQLEEAAYRHLGTVWQLELWRSDQPIAATVILTSDASDIPVGATIRVTGYFVMIRQYYSESKRLRQSALLMAQGPTLVSRSVARTAPRSGAAWIVGLVVAGIVALLVTWLVLRRSVSRSREGLQTVRATGPAPVSLADDLAAWAAEQPYQPPDEDAKSDTDQT